MLLADMIVFSGFDGMSCGQHALEQAGIPVEKYYSSEIDKYAITITQKNYPGTIQLGDIENWRSWDIDWASIGLAIGGSPCQGFSFAGKQLNFSDPRSKLFFIWVDILNEIKKHNPEVAFLLENVNMKKEYLRIISEYLGVFPVRLNSRLISAQNRDRWYWTNIRTKETGLFSELWTDIPEPEDKGILLKDILQPEEEVDEKYYLSDTALEYIQRGKERDRDRVNISDGNGKSTCITQNYHKGVHNQGETYICMALTERRTVNAKKVRRETGTNDFRDKELLPREDNKVGALQTGQTNEHIILLQKPRGKNTGGEHENKSPSMTSSSWQDNHHLTDGQVLRRLTPIECERLQTMPDNYTEGVSDTQRYKMLGNGWTSAMITYILGHYENNPPREPVT